VGDRVALEAGVPCSRCRTCLEGRYNLCRDVRFLGSFLSKCPGALAQRLLHPAAFCHALPDGVSLEEGALLEPLNVALAAVRRGGVAPGHRVLVTGAGAVGLVTLMAARAAGAAHVAVTDVQPGRLALARQLGASETLHARERDVVAEVRAGTMPPFDVTIECSGADPCIACVPPIHTLAAAPSCIRAALSFCYSCPD
jgi:L-iditol 2-dehydrogenase